MFGKYFKHVLIMTLLAGSAYSLPQVKEAMVGAFSLSFSEEALVSNYANYESTQMVKDRAIAPAPRREDEISQAQNRGNVPPEEIVATLFKAGIIPKEKITLAIKVLKEHASTTKPVRPPFNASTTPPFASSTRPVKPPFNASSTRPIK